MSIHSLLFVLMSMMKQLCVLILIFFQTWVHIAVFWHSWVQKNGYVYSWVQFSKLISFMKHTTDQRNIFCFDQFQYEASFNYLWYSGFKESLAQHKGVIYICGQCGYKSTSKGHLAKHKGQCMHGFNTLADNVTIRQHQRVILLSIKGQCIWMSQVTSQIMWLSGNIRE